MNIIKNLEELGLIRIIYKDFDPIKKYNELKKTIEQIKKNIDELT